MSKPTTSANANVDFNVADLAQIIANFADNDRNDLAIVIENGTEHEFNVNFKVDHGAYHQSNGSPILNALTFEEGGHPKATHYEMSFQAEGAGCNVVLTLKSPSFPDQFFLMAATPANRSNYFKLALSRELLDQWEKNYSDDGFKTFDIGVLRFIISITGTSPAVCKVLIVEI